MPNSIYDDEQAGRSALLLVESLIHSLVSRSVLTLEEAVEIVEIAADADQQTAQALNGTAAPLSVLTIIANSLRIDLARRSGPMDGPETPAL